MENNPCSLKRIIKIICNKSQCFSYACVVWNYYHCSSEGPLKYFHFLWVLQFILKPSPCWRGAHLSVQHGDALKKQSESSHRMLQLVPFPGKFEVRNKENSCLDLAPANLNTQTMHAPSQTFTWEAGNISITRTGCNFQASYFQWCLWVAEWNTQHLKIMKQHVRSCPVRLFSWTKFLTFLAHSGRDSQPATTSSN